MPQKSGMILLEQYTRGRFLWILSDTKMIFLWILSNFHCLFLWIFTIY